MKTSVQATTLPPLPRSGAAAAERAWRPVTFLKVGRRYPAAALDAPPLRIWASLAVVASEPTRVRSRRPRGRPGTVKKAA